MNRNWHKKNPEKNALIRFSYPPFTRIIKISDLQLNQKNNFTIRLNDQETANLIRFLGITNIFSFNCKINFKPFQGGWLILGIINLIASQQCVITLDNVRTKLKISLRRMLISEDNIAYSWIYPSRYWKRLELKGVTSSNFKIAEHLFLLEVEKIK